MSMLWYKLLNKFTEIAGWNNTTALTIFYYLSLHIFRLNMYLLELFKCITQEMESRFWHHLILLNKNNNFCYHCLRTWDKHLLTFKWNRLAVHQFMACYNNNKNYHGKTSIIYIYIYSMSLIYIQNKKIY